MVIAELSCTEATIIARNFWQSRWFSFYGSSCQVLVLRKWYENVDRQPSEDLLLIVVWRKFRWWLWLCSVLQRPGRRWRRCLGLKHTSLSEMKHLFVHNRNTYLFETFDTVLVLICYNAACILFSCWLLHCRARSASEFCSTITCVTLFRLWRLEVCIDRGCHISHVSAIDSCCVVFVDAFDCVVLFV